MAFLLGVFAALAVWFWWAMRRRDRLTLLPFDVWRLRYESADSLADGHAIAAAFLAQSLHFAVESGAIEAKHKRAIARTFKTMGSCNALMLLLGKALPAVHCVVGQAEVDRSPARAVGALLLLAWIAPEGRGDAAIRSFLN